MDPIVFYSWQSDLPNSTNRGFIGKALDDCLKQVRKDVNIVVNPVIDRDTLGIPGSPDIVQTIFDKIDKASAFVCDISIINDHTTDESTPNPNVLIELGYALKALGSENIIMVQNTSFGDEKLLPFDLHGKRVLTYSISEEDENKSRVRRELESKFRNALQTIFNKYVDEVPLALSILYNSKVEKVDMTLDPTWKWELIFNMANFAFANNPKRKLAKEFPKDLSEYRVLDLISKSWIEPPLNANELTSDQLVLVHKTELSKFPELKYEAKGKTFAILIKKLQK